ncbi:MAG: terpene synthase [Pelatocladus maniniholoensis HA4357-MV3]|jgi:5-epi-alpha-selinene synthase|uniref:Terpene synthase n=1 Tax=Pelatocladus maniniholoensis HA4357-MV3 TaxID=1117104 RepID=A0A9E3H962_9NOST|nr:terpene synthase [Pelatocladus maniniholoensis HA4357-MV3]BAZ67068.1 terpene synthase metal-binding domain-containing protein [Fischerella sp. NIES-4106]
MNQFTLPELYCPFPSQINKYVDVLEDYALEWVLRFNLLANESSYERFSKSKFFLLSAAAFPECELEELKVVNDWVTWLFIWDDVCDMSALGKKPELIEFFHNRFLEVLKGAEVTSNDISFSYALDNIQQRILEKGTKRWFDYFVHAVENYFTGCILEAENRSQGIVPNVDIYTSIHMLSGAMESSMEFIEFCNHLIIPDVLRANDILRKLTNLTNKIVCWCNDIFSASREMASGDVHNLVLVLHYQQNLSLEQAMKRAVEMHNQEIQKMIDLEDFLPSFGEELDSEITKYISGLHSWISGNLDWSLRSGRYQNLEKLDLLKL